MAAPGPPVAGTFAGAQSGTSSPTLPAGIVADEVVLVAALSHNPNGPTTAFGWPAGYTEIFAVDIFDSSGVKLGMAGAAWHRATGVESGTINVTRDGDTGTDTIFTTNCWRITGCKTTGNPYDVVQTNSPNPGGSATLDFPSITTLVADALLMSGGLVGGSNTVYATPTNWTASSSTGTNSGTDGSIDMDYRAPGSTGAYDPASPTITVDADTAWCTFQISFIPPGSATAYTDSGTGVLVFTPSGGDAQDRVDAGTGLVKFTPSGTDLLVPPGIFDSGTVAFALAPSGSDIFYEYPDPGTHRGLMALYVSSDPVPIDAATVALKFTVSGTDIQDIHDLATVRLSLTPLGTEFSSVPPPPPTPSITPFSFEAPTEGFIDWKVVHLNNALQQVGEVTPINPDWALYHDRAGYINYEIDSQHRLATPLFTKPKVTFYQLWRGTTLISAGPHSELRTALGQTNLEIAGQTWEWYFDNLQWPFDPDNIDAYPFKHAGVDVFVIVDAMLDTVLAQPYTIPFTYNLGTMGTTIDYKIELADSETILAKLTDLGDREPGFDMRITPEREILLQSPRIGINSGYHLEQGVNIEEMDYTDTGHQGTELLGIAETPDGKVGVKMNDLLNIPDRRLWQMRKDYGRLASKVELTARVTRDFEKMRTPLRQLTVKIVPREFENVWAQIKPGDTVHVSGETDYEPVDGDFRNIGMQGSVSEGGSEEITFTFDDDTLEF